MTTWYTASDPDAQEVSHVFQVWATNLGHVRTACESGGISEDKCREYGLEIGLGILSPTVSVSVVAPLDIASIIGLCEGNGESCPWTLFQVKLIVGGLTTAQEGVAWVHDPRPPRNSPRERSRDESGENDHVGQKAIGDLSHK